jgi:hypothetical protein
MFEGVALKRAVNRANQLIAGGDPEAARDELSAFVAKYPRSVQGWGTLLAAVGIAGGTIEQRLDVLRSAAAAVPYELTLVDHLVHKLIEACVLIGDTGYLDEAERAIAAHEEVLGGSADSLGMRALVAQFRGDDENAVALCDRATGSLEHYPNAHLSFRIGLCLSSIRGHEARGVAMAEGAAKAAKRYDFFLLLAAVEESIDPSKAEEYRAQAERVARGDPEKRTLERDLERARDDLRNQRRYLASIQRR